MSGSREEDIAAQSGDPACFSAYLKDTGQAFLLLAEADGQQAQVRFTGPYDGKDVVWDCCFVKVNSATGRREGTLGYKVNSATGRREGTLGYTVARESQQTDSGSPELNENYIDIGEPLASGIPLRVCLNLECIDLPAIQKMIVMIRNYKRLRQGRHKFGEKFINP